jgi:hypothetical protein
MNAIDTTRNVLNYRITPIMWKALIATLIIGIIVILLVWIPTVFNNYTDSKNIISEIDNLVPVRSDDAQNPFNYKEFITWVFSALNSFIILLLGIKKLLGKK